jgi:hypothetical protein
MLSAAVVAQHAMRLLGRPIRVRAPPAGPSAHLKWRLRVEQAAWLLALRTTSGEPSGSRSTGTGQFCLAKGLSDGTL